MPTFIGTKRPKGASKSPGLKGSGRIPGYNTGTGKVKVTALPGPKNMNRSMGSAFKVKKVSSGIPRQQAIPGMKAPGNVAGTHSMPKWGRAGV